MQIYISRNGERYGPYSMPDVQADIEAGNIQPTDLAWHDGAAGWVEVWQIDGITLPKRRVPPPPPPAPAAVRAGNYPATPPKPASRVDGVELAFLTVLTLLLPIVGIVLGIIRISNPEKRSGGLILLIISIVIMILYAVLYFH